MTRKEVKLMRICPNSYFYILQFNSAGFAQLYYRMEVIFCTWC